MDKKTVLIVDDVYFMRNLLKKELKEAGYEVVGEAKNGKEGIKYYFELKPDLVTMDIKMPDISGIEVTKQILSKDPNAKILAISGNSDEEIKKEILRAGALDYLQKPFQPAFLWNKLTKILNQEQCLEEDDFEETEVLSNEEDIIVIQSGSESIEDDMEEELIILSKPDESKQRTLVIKNEEDSIVFPEEYIEEELEDIEKNMLSEENLIELETEDDILIEIIEEDEEIIIQPKVENNSFFDNENVSLQEETIDYKEDIKVIKPMSIRPPRGNFHNEREDNQSFEEIEEPILNYEEDLSTKAPKGLLGKIKNIFKR